MHLFSGDVEAAGTVTPDSSTRAVNSTEKERLPQLEIEVRELRKELTRLTQQLASFRKQFE